MFLVPIVFIVKCLLIVWALTFKNFSLNFDWLSIRMNKTSALIAQTELSQEF